MPSWFRWILVIPSSLIAWAATLFVGMMAHGYAERILCPPEDLISGYCMNEVVVSRLGQIVIAFAGLSATAFVGAAVGMAPKWKVAVAWVAFIIGALFALLLFGGSVECYSALLLGAITCTAISLYCRR